MNPTDALVAAEGTFDSPLAGVRPDQWATPTGCEGWSVSDLARHVIGANRMSVALLGGGDRAAGIAAMACTEPDDQLVEAFRASAAAQAAAFAAPGAMGGTVAHPIGDIPAGQLFEFRIIDLAIHGWDLAVATGQSPDIDPALVAFLWERLEPRAGHLASTGVFGSGSTGQVPEDAPLQSRLLDILGRG
ncbi:MAG: TIGR03086 family metal-binding protein [Candidatus Nanopelagicales bacterium]|nr:TIGR03086 family metal-binding protein [Candidatus Nanopelagicales bacterium]